MSAVEAAAEIAIVAPEPAAWLAAVAAAASRVAPVRILAPWAASPAAIRFARRLPAPVAGFAERRAVPGSYNVTPVFAWGLGEAALRLWARGLAPRLMRARLLTRRAVDVWAARWLARAAPRPRLVLAPSLAAHRTFARAAHLRIGAVLIEDIPRIRRLHADLDRAAQNHPECVFLRHYRAPDPALVRQEVERALADILVVRGIYARDLCRRAGVADERIAALPDDPRGETPDDLRYSREAAGRRARLSGQPLRVRLAGLAAARHGTVEALAAIAERPAIELVIRAGEGLEPSELLSHPRVVWASGAALTALDDVVIAPAWCESYPREVALARAAGVPVIATRRAAGFVEPDHIIEPGDSEALGRALDRVRDALRAGAPAVRSRRAPNDSLEQALARALASDPPVRPAR